MGVPHVNLTDYYEIIFKTVFKRCVVELDRSWTRAASHNLIFCAWKLATILEFILQKRKKLWFGRWFTKKKDKKLTKQLFKTDFFIINWIFIVWLKFIAKQENEEHIIVKNKDKKFEKKQLMTGFFLILWRILWFLWNKAEIIRDNVWIGHFCY